MFESEMVSFLESGCALIVGTVGADGTPLATRGWGITVVPGDDAGRLRLLLDGEDAATRHNVQPGSPIAITACCVSTLRSQQLKGRVVSVEECDVRDRARADRYCDAFYDDILHTDGTPRSLTNRITPARYFACTVAVDEIFDQTPGPAAGNVLASRRR